VSIFAGKCEKPFRVTKNLSKWQYPDGLMVPCGKCLPCRIRKRSEWALRMLHELSYHEDSMFITLTYEDKYLPENNSLEKVALQKFFKRLRKRISEETHGKLRIKYFACGEYGENPIDPFGPPRPHYHAIIFGLSLLNREYVTSAWPYGYVHFGLAERDSIRYVAQYIDKKYSGELEDEYYTQTGRQNVFRILSQGLGRAFCIEHSEQIQQQKKITHRGVQHSIPRYYIKKLEIDTDLLKSRALDLDSNNVKKYTGLDDLTGDELYKLSSSEFTKYYEGMRSEIAQNVKNQQARIDMKTESKNQNKA